MTCGGILVELCVVGVLVEVESENGDPVRCREKGERRERRERERRQQNAQNSSIQGQTNHDSDVTHQFRHIGFSWHPVLCIQGVHVYKRITQYSVWPCSMYQ